MVHLFPRFQGFTAAPHDATAPLHAPWMRSTIELLRLRTWLPTLDDGRARITLLCAVALLAVAAAAAMAAGGMGLVAQWIHPHTPATPILWAAAGAVGATVGCLIASATWWWGEVRGRLFWAIVDQGALDARCQEAVALYADIYDAPPPARGVQAKCVWYNTRDGLVLVRCGWQATDLGATLARWPDAHNRPRVPRADLLPRWALLFEDILWDQHGALVVSSAPQDLHSAHARLAIAAARLPTD